MKLTKTKLKQLIKEEIGRTMIEGDEGEKLTFGQLASEWEKREHAAEGGEELSVEDDEEEMTDDEKLAKALHDILRHFLDEVGMENDEVQSAVEKALEVELGSDMGKIIAQAGL